MMDFGTASREFASEWSEPLLVLPLLLIFGGDVTCLAFAQLAGGNATPVAFSIGWVAYAISALVSIASGKKLMPQPDCHCVVVNGDNGLKTENSSWILGRLIQDFENWMDPLVEKRLFEIRKERWRDLQTKSEWERDLAVVNQGQVGLCVSVYEPDFTCVTSVPRRDLLYYSCILTVLLQIGISFIPLGIYGDWGVLLITVSGILLASVVAALPQWRAEKWVCRGQSQQTVVLTRGPRSQHAVLILGNHHGPDFEDLARGQESNPRTSSLRFTRITLLVVAVLSLALLITASGKQSHIWYQIGVLAIGTAQNMSVITMSRSPGAFGIHLRFIEVIAQTQMMDALFQVEERFPHVGKSMLQFYLPGELSSEDKARWDDFRTKAENITLRRQKQEQKLEHRQQELRVKWEKVTRQEQQEQAKQV